MEFLKDQELFKDLREDGTLPSYIRHDCSIGACSVYKQALRDYGERMKGKYVVNYKGRDRDPYQSEFRSAVDGYKKRAFVEGYEAVMNHVATAEEIGSFPVSKFYITTLSVEDYDPISLEVELKDHLPSAEISALQELERKSVKALEGRASAGKSRAASFFVLLHLLALAYSAAMILFPGFGLPCWIGDWLQNLLVGGGILLLLIIGAGFHFENMMLPLLTVVNAFFSFYLLMYLCTRPDYEYQHINAAVAMGLTAITLVRYLVDGFGGFNRSVQKDFVKEFDENAQVIWKKIRFRAMWEKEVLGKESAPEGSNEETLRSLASLRKKFR